MGNSGGNVRLKTRPEVRRDPQEILPPGEIVTRHFGDGMGYRFQKTFDGLGHSLHHTAWIPSSKPSQRSNGRTSLGGHGRINSLTALPVCV